MPSRPSRRALLASLGTIALAGCTGDDDADGSSPTTTSDVKPTTSSTDAPTSSPGSTPSPTPEPTPEAPSTIGSEWPMPAHDPGRSNYAPAAAGPTDRVAELWRVTADGDLSAPVVAGGTLFVGGADGSVLALDARSGDERWRRSVGGPAATPRVMDGQVYVPTRSSIAAFDADDGGKRWRVETPDRVDGHEADGRGEPSSLLVAAHGVYWLSRGGTPAVVALASDDGSERWRTEIRDPWSPRLFASDDTVFLSSGTHGRIPWRFDPESGTVAEEPAPGYDFPDERFFLDGAVYGVDPMFGIVHGPGWTAGGDEFATGGDYGLSGGADNVYYVPNNDAGPGIVALERSDGATAWRTDDVTMGVSRPVVATRTVLVRTDGALHCFDPADGSERWRRPSEGIGDGVVVVDDLLFATHDDTVRAFRPP
ncbi:MAG: outer membrane protein assembly factor BamB [Halobacteriales archaeon]|jgi:outer membrane protein assembly factor BamB